MIRFSWLQLRWKVRVALAAVLAVALILVVTGPHLASLYAASAIADCHGGTCATAANTFLSRMAITSPYPIVYELGIGLILASPAVIGIFWGAPLVAREFETRTFTLAWTQSITRTRWLVVKLAMTGLAAMVSLSDPQPALSSAVQCPPWPSRWPSSPPLRLPCRCGSARTSSRPIGPSSPARRSSRLRGVNLGNLTATQVPGRPGAWILSSGAVNAAGQRVSTVPAPCVPPPPARPPSNLTCRTTRAELS